MNYKAITKEALLKLDEIVELSKKSIDLYQEMRMSMLYHAIKEGVCKVEVQRTKRTNIIVGAKAVWDNGDELMLDRDVFSRVVNGIDFKFLSFAQQVSKAKWNNTETLWESHKKQEKKHAS